MNNKIPNSPIGIYIHIPFCKSKCPYCDFYSVINNCSLYDDFVRCLLKEIRNIDGRFNKKLIVDTIYLGGGTPSILESDQIANIIETLRDRYIISEEAEITAETNPESVNQSKLEAFHAIGINRISIGVQSFSDKDLKILGRIHNSKQAINAIDSAKKAGFENLSVDFMFNIPDQDISTVEENIRTAHELGIHHISYYGLTIEKGTVFDDEYKSGQLNLPDDESYKKAFNTIVKTCAEYGYEQYEISNYSKEDYRCRHNLNYWNYGSYLGFGPSAHGAIISRQDRIMHAVRYGNIKDVIKYIHSIKTNDSAVDFEENLDSDKINIEKLLLGLRTNDGYKLNDSERNENLRFNKAFHELLQSFINDGFIKSTPDNRIAINREYMVLSDEIISSLSRYL